MKIKICSLLWALLFVLTALNWKEAETHLASPPFAGDIQIGMEDKKGQLEVEVIRARSLTQKPGSKSTPGKEKYS